MARSKNTAVDGSDPSPRASRWWQWAAYLLGLVLILAVIAVTIAWTSREQLADDFIAGEIDRLDLPATYEIESIGTNRQVLRNVVIGDPGAPDLTIERVEIETVLGIGGVSIDRVVLQRPVLAGTLDEGGVSFGALDRVLFRDSGEEEGLPDLNVTVEDGRARLDGPFGPLEARLDGKGRLDGGFAGTFQVEAPALAIDNCRFQGLEASGRVNVRSGRPTFNGPVRLAELACANPRLRMRDFASPARVAIDATLDGLEAEIDGSAEALTALELTAGESDIAGTVALRDGRLRKRYVLGLGSVVVPGVALERLDVEGTAQRSGEGIWRAEADIAGREAGITGSVDRQLASLERNARETLIAPLTARLRGGLRRLSRGSAVTASVTLTYDAQGLALVVPQAEWVAANGDSLLAVSRLQATPSGRPIPRLSANFVTGGEGLPAMRGVMERDTSGQLLLRMAMREYRAGSSRMIIPDLVIAQSNGGRFTFGGSLQVSGPLPDGQVRELALPVRGSFDGRRLSAWPGCTRVAFSALEYGDLEVDRRALTLCPAQGRSILTADSQGIRVAAGVPQIEATGRLAGTPIDLRGGPIGFAWPGVLTARSVDVTLGREENAARFAVRNLDARLGGELGGTFSEADVELDAVPLLLRETSGEWSYRNGALRVSEAAFRLEDRDADPRFKPVFARGADLILQDNLITANALIREERTDRVVTRVKVTHDLREETGLANLTVPGLAFDDRLQPDDLTRLTFGLVADVQGLVTGNGVVRWNSENVTSEGSFSSSSMDLAAPFGPLEDVSGTITFDDLLGLTTAPNQSLAVGSVNTGIAVEGATLGYSLREGEFLTLQGGSAPFLGGTLTLRGMDLRLGRKEERAYIFDIDGLDAAKLLERLELGNINATGIFDGSITVLFDSEGNGRIVDGLLTSRAPGGNVAYIGELTYEDLTPIANFAFEALRSLDYNQLAVEFEGPLTGEIITRMRFVGVAQGEGARRNLVTRALADLPIEFRINITAQFYQLLRDVRSLYDPAFLPDPRSLGLLTDDGVRLRRRISGEEAEMARLRREEAERTIAQQDIQDRESEGSQ